MESKVVKACPGRVTVPKDTAPAGSPAARIYASIDSQSLKAQSGGQDGVASITQTDTAQPLELDVTEDDDDASIF